MRKKLFFILTCAGLLSAGLFSRGELLAEHPNDDNGHVPGNNMLICHFAGHDGDYVIGPGGETTSAQEHACFGAGGTPIWLCGAAKGGHGL